MTDPSAPAEPSWREMVDEMVDYLDAAPDGDDEFVSRTPPWFGDRMFGGWVIAMALNAAMQTVDGDRWPHSLHAYFLRPVMFGVEVRHRVSRLRDGRSFTSRHVAMEQGGKPVLWFTCSFHEDEEGDEYQLPMPDVPDPDDLPASDGPGPWLQRNLGPTDVDDRGVIRSSTRQWLCLPSPAPGDARIQAPLLAYFSDMTLHGGRPLNQDVIPDASLDHAVWFHRRGRADEWFFFDVEPVANHGARSLIRGTFHDRSGTLLLSMAQEMLIRSPR